MPPPNLQVTIIRADTQVLIIGLKWEEPVSLINNSITNYTVRVNISLIDETSEYLFLDYETIMTETSLLYNISQDGIHLCSISVVTVDVSANNKVGTGEAARNMLKPNIDSEPCTSEASIVVGSSSAMLSTTDIPPLYPGLKAVSSRKDTNRMLVYGKYGEAK